MLDIPELLDRVLSFLPKQDLARCTLVNKQWHVAMTPRLWKTISFLNGHQKRAFWGMVLIDFLVAKVDLRKQLDIKGVKQNQKSGQDYIKDKSKVQHRPQSPRPSLWKYYPWIRKLNNPQDIFEGPGDMVSNEELFAYFLKHCVCVKELTLDVYAGIDDESYPLYKVITKNISPNLQEICFEGSYSGYPSVGLLLRQGIVYRSFFRLEKLAFHTYPDRIYDSICEEDCRYKPFRMTLESGLNVLKELKHLRELDVDTMNQRIGPKEVEWMTQHWPRLMVIRGLCDQGSNLEAAEWLWTHAPTVKVELSTSV